MLQKQELGREGEREVERDWKMLALKMKEGATSHVMLAAS